MILLVANTKGGVGKSTLAINLAVERAHWNPNPGGGDAPFVKNVLVIDGDRQETALTALARRAEEGTEPSVNVISLGEASAMRTQAPRLGIDYDDVVIDAGGRDNPALRAAMMIADKLLMPFAPTQFDLWEVENMATLIEEAQVYNPDLQAAAVLTKVPAQGTDADDAAAMLEGFDQFGLLETRIGQRVAFGRAAARGQSVSEWSPQDPKANEELTALMTEVYGEQS